MFAFEEMCDLFRVELGNWRGFWWNIFDMNYFDIDSESRDFKKNPNGLMRLCHWVNERYQKGTE